MENIKNQIKEVLTKWNEQPEYSKEEACREILQLISDNYEPKKEEEDYINTMPMIGTPPKKCDCSLKDKTTGYYCHGNCKW
jgi:hypothetical protein